MEMDLMETELTAIADAVTYPPTPDLASGFWRHLQERRRTPELAPPWGLAAAGLAAAVVVIAVVIGTIAPARDAAADIFDRINVFRVDESALEGITRDIEGEEVTLAEAGTRLGRPIDLPTYPEGVQDSITRVVYDGFPQSPLAYAAVFFEPGSGKAFVLFATNGQAGKGLAPGATAEQVDELLGEAYWLQGLRIVQTSDDSGRIVESQRVTDANTLIWLHDGYIYRIEGELDREEAIAIATSVK